MSLISTPPKQYYTAHISYNGTNYYGWQRQKSLPTIQSLILDALKEIAPAGTSVNIIGASRTDAKVHALDQVAQIIVQFSMAPSDLKNKLNSLLPSDISILNITPSHSKFMVIYQAKQKEYFYLFSNQSNPYLSDSHIVNFIEPLNFSRMRQACTYLKGKHSFHNFQYKMNPRNSAIRELFECRIVEDPSYAPNKKYPVYALEVSANGFLKQMVRILMGTLINMGQGIHHPQEVFSSFHPESPQKLGFISPADGLHLQKIHY